MHAIRWRHQTQNFRVFNKLHAIAGATSILGTTSCQQTLSDKCAVCKHWARYLLFGALIFNNNKKLKSNIVNRDISERIEFVELLCVHGAP